MTIPTFPTLIGIAFPVQRKVSWSTAREEAFSGKTARYARRTIPRWTWTVSLDVLRQNHNSITGELATLAGFFNSIRGGALPFYYTDADDYTVTGQQFGAGDGTTTAFQLLRSFGGFAEPVYGNPTITTLYVAGVATTAYTVSATGLVTFTSAPAAGAALTWDGTYSWLCEMDEDDLTTVLFMKGLYSVKEFSFSNKIV